MIMEDMIYKVTVFQRDGSVEFEFNQISDAVKFAGTCMEVGMPETKVCIKSEKKEEE
jgi:hypothetical protein